MTKPKILYGGSRGGGKTTLQEFIHKWSIKADSDGEVITTELIYEGYKIVKKIANKQQEEFFDSLNDNEIYAIARGRGPMTGLYLLGKLIESGKLD